MRHLCIFLAASLFCAECVLSPRPNVHVLASLDKKAYVPSSDLKMGDHSVIWTSEHLKARNIYIFMGHRPEHFDNKSFTQIFANSIFWAGSRWQEKAEDHK